MRNFLTSIFFISYFGFTIAQETPEDGLFVSDTLNVKKLQVIGVPAVFYTPETEFGFGAGAQFFLHTQTNLYNSRTSNILVTGIYTTKQQLMLEAKPKIYLLYGDIYIDGYAKYRVFPNSFWGIGNALPESNMERYNMTSIEFAGAVLKRMPPSLNFGFEYELRHHTVTEVKDGGLLDTTLIPGAEGAVTSSFSFVFNLDDRNNEFSAESGNFMQLKAGFSSKVLGATYSYNKYIIDLRKYFTLSTKYVLAAQAYLEDTFGDVPFQSMAWLGGGERGRGYFRGRYMDKHNVSLQSELRYKIVPRLRVVAFVSAAQVSPYPEKYSANFHYSYGGGIRFQLSKKTPSLIRLDVGIGEDGNSGIYFGVNEAF